MCQKHITSGVNYWSIERKLTAFNCSHFKILLYCNEWQAILITLMSCVFCTITVFTCRYMLIIIETDEENNNIAATNTVIQVKCWFAMMCIDPHLMSSQELLFCTYNFLFSVNISIELPVWTVKTKYFYSFVYCYCTGSWKNHPIVTKSTTGGKTNSTAAANIKIIFIRKWQQSRMFMACVSKYHKF